MNKLKNATLLTILALVFVGCGLTDSKEPIVVQLPAAAPATAAPVATADPLQLKTYVVPAGYEDATASILSSLLWRKEGSVGRVHKGAAGTLHVVAPVGLQDGVAALVKGLTDKTGGPPSRPGAIQVDYWLVRGYRVEAATKRPELAGVQTTLDAIEGAQQFELVDRISLVSLDGHRAENHGRRFHVAQTVARDGEDFMADVKIGSDRRELETRVRLRPEQSLVLGQLGVGGADSADDQALYYIIRATAK